MIRYLLDTNVAIALLRGHEGALRNASAMVAEGSVAISTCSVGELYYGIYASARAAQEREAIEELLAALTLLDYDEAAAREYGRLRAVMQRAGHPIPTMDTQIAATALANDLVAVSADRHFSLVPGLLLENWLEPSAGS